jgi:hypothetical protein
VSAQADPSTTPCRCRSRCPPCTPPTRGFMTTCRWRRGKSRAFLEFLRKRQGRILSASRPLKALDEDIEKRLKAALEEFKKAYKA